MQAGNYCRVDSDRRGARIGLWDRPVPPTITLFDRDRIFMNTAPLKADELAYPKTGPHGYVNHGRVGLGNELHQVMELLRCYRWLRPSRSLIEW